MCVCACVCVSVCAFVPEVAKTLTETYKMQVKEIPDCHVDFYSRVLLQQLVPLAKQEPGMWACVCVLGVCVCVCVCV